MKKTIPYFLIACIFVLGMTGLNYQQTIGKRIITPMVWASNASQTQTETINLRGKCTQIEFDCSSDTTNNITYTLKVTTEDLGTLFSVASIADDGSTILKATSDATDFDAFLAGDNVIVTVTPSGVPGGTTGATVNVGFYVE
uniref:Uncharacterized protein n=1 Tax=viral metagenome TaxID=1070528 RepID=A0A6M3JCJ6_9ZZZZ